MQVVCSPLTVPMCTDGLARVSIDAGRVQPPYCSNAHTAKHHLSCPLLGTNCNRHAYCCRTPIARALRMAVAANSAKRSALAFNP
eukprot:1159745-Pelagomonas_calceolata.AAC.10